MAAPDDDFSIINSLQDSMNAKDEQFSALPADSDDHSGDEANVDLSKKFMVCAGPGKDSPSSGFKGSYVRTPGVNPMCEARENHDPGVLVTECGLDERNLIRYILWLAKI